QYLPHHSFPQNDPSSLDSKFLAKYLQPPYLTPIHPLKFEQSPFDFQKSATPPYTSHLLPNAQSTTAYLPILSAPFYFVPPSLLGPLEVQLPSCSNLLLSAILSLR